LRELFFILADPIRKGELFNGVNNSLNQKLRRRKKRQRNKMKPIKVNGKRRQLRKKY